MNGRGLLHALAVAAALAARSATTSVVAAAPQPEPSQPAVSQTAAADCARAQPQVMRTIDAANMRLESARQSNSAPAMRAAMDDLQGALAQLRAQLAACRDLETAAAGHAMPGMPQTPAASGAMPKRGSTPAAPAAPVVAAPAAADPHAGHTMPTPAPAAAPKPAAPMDHSKTPMAGDAHARAAQDGKVTDPVTGLRVDPAIAPKVTHQGQTYYFSSEQAREEFLQNPAKFARKPKP